MKRIVGLLLVVAMCFGLVACGDGAVGNEEVSESAEVADSADEVTAAAESADETGYPIDSAEPQYTRAEFENISFEYNATAMLNDNGDSVSVLYVPKVEWIMVSITDLSDISEAMKGVDGALGGEDEMCSYELNLYMSIFSDRQSENTFSTKIAGKTAAACTFVGKYEGALYNICIAVFPTGDGRTYYIATYSGNVSQSVIETGYEYHTDDINLFMESIEFIQTKEGECTNEKVISDDVSGGNLF